MFFGFVHAYLIWFGDILTLYAFCGLFVIFFINRGPWLLLILGILFNVLLIWLVANQSAFNEMMPPEEVAQQAKWAMQMWAPDAQTLQQEIDAMTGTWAQAHQERKAMAIELQAIMLFLTIPTIGTMLIGMALYKWQVLSAQRSDRYYQLMMLLGWAIGLPIVIYGAFANESHQWAMEYAMEQGDVFNLVGCIPVALGQHRPGNACHSPWLAQSPATKTGGSRSNGLYQLHHAIGDLHFDI